MADITNVQAVTFSDAYLRLRANEICQFYFEAKQTLSVYTAQSHATYITDTSDPIIDGSATDGRPIVTGAQARDLIDILTAFVADMEASTNAKLNSCLQVASNPQP